jgi:hypothetical protein
MKIEIGTIIRKRGKKDFYEIINIFDGFVEVDKMDKNWLLRVSNLTEYVLNENIEGYTDESENKG